MLYHIVSNHIILYHMIPYHIFWIIVYYILSCFQYVLPWIQYMVCLWFFGPEREVFNHEVNASPKLWSYTALDPWIIWGVPKIMGFPPNHPILIGFSIINHPFWGIPIFGNIHIWIIGFFCGLPGSSILAMCRMFFFNQAQTSNILTPAAPFPW